jgi:hypothetical protein
MAYGTPETMRLREGIRDGSICCPDNGRRCNSRMAQHVEDCQWFWAIKRIYKLERAYEGIDA